MSPVELHRLTVECHACGETITTYISGSFADEAEGRAAINAVCDEHTRVCLVRADES